MKRRAKDWPFWAGSALQGVTFWIGHRRCLYRHWPLSEGAIVAEVCNLIHANLPDKFHLQCEVRYSKIMDRWPDALGVRARADLVVTESEKPKFVIEVKRGSASNADIDADLHRLAVAYGKLRTIQAYLMLVSEAHRPTRFVDKEGKSIRNAREVPKTKGLFYYRVRRTWKAAHAFNVREHAQYACLIEVYPKIT